MALTEVDGRMKVIDMNGDAGSMGADDVADHAGQIVGVYGWSLLV
jgi:hypothetical protein